MQVSNLGGLENRNDFVIQACPITSHFLPYKNSTIVNNSRITLGCFFINLMAIINKLGRRRHQNVQQYLVIVCRELKVYYYRCDRDNNITEQKNHSLDDMEFFHFLITVTVLTSFMFGFTFLLTTYKYVHPIDQESKGNYENGATFQCASTLVTKTIRNNNTSVKF